MKSTVSRQDARSKCIYDHTGTLGLGRSQYGMPLISHFAHSLNNTSVEKSLSPAHGALAWSHIRYNDFEDN